MKWIEIRDRSELPRDKVFLGLWKGAICLCEFDENDQRFYICMMPACTSGIMKVDQEREGKFTHYMLIDLPKDY